MNQFDLKNKVAVITGGAQGFGLDIAKKFLKFGALKVIIWDNDKTQLESAAQKINNSKLSHNLVDVSDFQKINNTVKEITKETKIDILINQDGTVENVHYGKDIGDHLPLSDIINFSN